MTLDELKQKYPELVKAVTLEATQAVENQFSNEITSIKTEVGELREENKSLKKDNAIRQENERRADADRFWNEALAQSNIPEYLFDKVKAMVSYTKFMEDGKLNVEKFNEAIKSEISDWETRGVSTEVMGTSFSTKDEVSSQTQKAQQLAKETDDTTNNLLKLAGQKTE